MKTFLASLLVLGVVIAASAQGTLNFANGAAGVNAPITHRWYADLYYGAQGSSAGSLTAAGFNVAFSTGASAGYFFGGVRVVSGFAPGSTITVQVRVWNSAAASTYEAAAANGADAGASNLINITLGGGVTPPPSLVGLQSFNVGTLSPPVAPEPSTFILGSLCVGALLVVRRRDT